MLIKVSDYTKTALSADDGVVIRNQILSISDPDEKITLDFSGITLYATMFLMHLLVILCLTQRKILLMIELSWRIFPLLDKGRLSILIITPFL